MEILGISYWYLCLLYKFARHFPLLLDEGSSFILHFSLFRVSVHIYLFALLAT